MSKGTTIFRLKLSTASSSNRARLTRSVRGKVRRVTTPSRSTAGLTAMRPGSTRHQSRRPLRSRITSRSGAACRSSPNPHLVPLAPSYREEPYWWRDAAPIRLPQAALPTEADVVIIGGGYTGMMAAARLAWRGRSVTVLEQNELGWGASSRNGGIQERSGLTAQAIRRPRPSALPGDAGRHGAGRGNDPRQPDRLPVCADRPAVPGAQASACATSR